MHHQENCRIHSERALAKRFATIIFAMVSVSACSTISDPFQVDPVIKGAGETVTWYGRPTQAPLDLRTLRYVQSKDGRPAYEEAIEDCTKAHKSCMAKRNQLQSHIMVYADQICDSHKAAITANRAVFNLAATLATVGLGTAGALVTGGASQVLAGVAAAVAGARAGVNEEVYVKFLAPAIVKKIDLNRKEFKERVIDENRKKPGHQYPVDEAIVDVQRYHMLCSFYAGLASLVTDGAQDPDRAVDARKSIDEQRKLYAESVEREAALRAKLPPGPGPERTRIVQQIALEQGIQGDAQLRIRALGFIR